MKEDRVITTFRYNFSAGVEVTASYSNFSGRLVGDISAETREVHFALAAPNISVSYSSKVSSRERSTTFGNKQRNAKAV